MRAICQFFAVAFLFLTVAANAQARAAYAPLKSEKYAQAFQRIGLLEKIGDSANANVRLPTPVALVARECGRSNAF